MSTYKIICGYFNDAIDDEVIEEGLTLEEAQAYCKDPETSSRTCTSLQGKSRTNNYGPWFHRYEEE